VLPFHPPSPFEHCINIKEAAGVDGCDEGADGGRSALPAAAPTDRAHQEKSGLLLLVCIKIQADGE